MIVEFPDWAEFAIDTQLLPFETIFLVFAVPILFNHRAFQQPALAHVPPKMANRFSFLVHPFKTPAPPKPTKHTPWHETPKKKTPAPPATETATRAPHVERRRDERRRGLRAGAGAPHLRLAGGRRLAPGAEPPGRSLPGALLLRPGGGDLRCPCTVSVLWG